MPDTLRHCEILMGSLYLSLPKARRIGCAVVGAAQFQDQSKGFRKLGKDQVLRDCSSHTTFELISKFLPALECAMLQPTSPPKTVMIFWYEELLPVLEWPEISICKSIFVLYLLL